MKIVKNIKYEAAKDPEVLRIANRLAELKKRKPLDAMRQFILEFGPISIAELTKSSQPAEPTVT